MIRSLSRFALLSIFMSGPLFAHEISANLPTTAPSGANFNVRSSMGFNVDPKLPENAILFEPILRYGLTNENELDFYAALYRPTQPLANSEIPKTQITFKRTIPWMPEYTSVLRLSAGADNLAAWHKEGYQMRATASLEFSRVIDPGITASLRVGPFGLLSRNRFYLDGSGIPQFGLTERIAFTYETGKLNLTAAFLQQQAKAGDWQMDFAIDATASYELNEHLTVGAVYGLASTVVDDAMGVYRPTYAYNVGRHSRISAVVDITF
jgi:hypothetical protein